MDIKITYRAVDGFNEWRKFKTLAGAKCYAVMRVGENAEIGSRYAVSFDGIGTVYVSGCTLYELFDRCPPGGSSDPFSKFYRGSDFS